MSLALAAPLMAAASVLAALPDGSALPAIAGNEASAARTVAAWQSAAPRLRAHDDGRMDLLLRLEEVGRAVAGLEAARKRLELGRAPRLGERYDEEAGGRLRPEYFRRQEALKREVAEMESRLRDIARPLFASGPR